MAPITEHMIRMRAEHNEGMITTLEEVALHQMNIEKVEVIGTLCRQLKILLLQSNLIGKIQNLHKLKKLEYLNLAVNNIIKIENLQRCESLTKLDLTVNFVAKQGLFSLHSLQHNIHLKELYLVGNPCSDWEGYRQFVIATLPNIDKLDGTEIKPSERIVAKQVYPKLEKQLREECLREGIDPDEWIKVEIPPEYDDEELEEWDKLNILDENGEKKRAWCPATRILEAREAEEEERKAQEQRKTEQEKAMMGNGPTQKRREKFDEIQEGTKILNKNEGKWDFSLNDYDSATSIVLDIPVGKFLDTSLIDVDVQPTFVRVLIKGKLLQLTLSEEVSPDKSVAQRNKHTGHLVITMPKLHCNSADSTVIKAESRKAAISSPKIQNGPKELKSVGSLRNIVKKSPDLIVESKHHTQADSSSDEDDDDDIPPLE